MCTDQLAQSQITRHRRKGEKMVRLAIVEFKKNQYNVVDPEELTDLGIGEVIYQCDRLKEKLEELHFQEMQADDDRD